MILEGDVENTRLHAKALVQKQVENGEIVLISAVRMSHEVVVLALIERVADINKAEDDGRTPLYIGAQNGHKAVVRALMQADEDVNKARDGGATPLSASSQPVSNVARGNHAAIVQRLWDAGAV